MKKLYFTTASGKLVKTITLALVLLFSVYKGFAQTETMPAGSFIINMGVTPQTVGNGLKPYGMIYDLIYNHGVPIKWIVNPYKDKDGIDFSHNGTDYRGGPFIIRAEYRTTAVNTRITYWQTQGVVGSTTISPSDVPVMKTLVVSSAPNWTLDKQNGSIALGFFTNAGIPPAAYGGNSSALWKNPGDLTCCDDIFVMPHADPKWATHSRLLSWNLECNGSIWSACHAGSALENMYNPANPSQQTNFLSEKVTTPGAGIILPVFGSTAYAQNSLILWTNHSAGTPPYSYLDHGDPIMQFLGIIDAATQNGSEQIYIPVNGVNSGWRSSTVVAVFDPDHAQIASSAVKHRAAVIAYGRGFGDENRGYIMYEAAHSINKALLPANIAAQRAFFNFSFLAAKDKAPDPEVTLALPTIVSGATQSISFTVHQPRTIGEFSILWESACGGSFSPNNTQTVNFTAPVVSAPTNCNITITLTDACGRVYKSTTVVSIICDLQIINTISSACYGLTNGSIVMSITGGSAPFIWSWTKTGGGTGSGTGTTISGLAPGIYTVTVTASNGAGCAKTFTVAITENPQILVTPTPANVLCNGASTGSINVSVSGGTPGYTYLWADGPTTQNRNSLPAGTYTVTVTDSKACTASASASISQPSAINITPSVTHVLCNGMNTGAISLGVSGGTPAFTYLWNDGSAAQNRTGLAAGTYSVTVTDANNCKQTLSNITVTQPTAISASASANPSPILCNGGTTTITVTAGGGTGTLQYSLNGGTYQISNQFTGVSASVTPYAIMVKDANNCTKTTNVTVTQPNAIVLGTTLVHPTCPPSANPPVNSDGTITLTVNGGTAPYGFVWSASNEGSVPPAQINDQNLTTLIAGTYTVNVTDNKGCTATTSVTLNYLNPNPVTPGTIIR